MVFQPKPISIENSIICFQSSDIFKAIFQFLAVGTNNILFYLFLHLSTILSNLYLT